MAEPTEAEALPKDKKEEGGEGKVKEKDNVSGESASTVSEGDVSKRTEQGASRATAAATPPPPPEGEGESSAMPSKEAEEELGSTAGAATDDSGDAAPAAAGQGAESLSSASARSAAEVDCKTLWMGDIQPTWDEAFVGNLFASHGASEVDVKLIRDRQSGLPAGYGFLDFPTNAEAEDALENINGKPIEGTALKFRLNWGAGGKRVEQPQEFSVFVGDLAPDITDERLRALFAEKFETVLGAKVVTNQATGISKGFGFVRFGSEEEGEKALETMDGAVCGNRPMRVAEATKRTARGRSATARGGGGGGGGSTSSAVDPAEDSQNRTVFVGGINAAVTENTLRAAFAHAGEIISVKTPPGRGCGFVNFAQRASAESVINSMQGMEIAGCQIRLSWGRTSSRMGGNRGGGASASVGPHGGGLYGHMGVGGGGGVVGYGGAAGGASGAQQQQGFYGQYGDGGYAHQIYGGPAAAMAYATVGQQYAPAAGGQLLFGQQQQQQQQQQQLGQGQQPVGGGGSGGYGGAGGLSGAEASSAGAGVGVAPYASQPASAGGSASYHTPQQAAAAAAYQQQQYYATQYAMQYGHAPAAGGYGYPQVAAQAGDASAGIGPRTPGSGGVAVGDLGAAQGLHQRAGAYQQQQQQQQQVDQLGGLVRQMGVQAEGGGGGRRGGGGGARGGGGRAAQQQQGGGIEKG